MPTDEKEFFVASSDQKGHSDRIWFRVMPGYSRRAEEVIASRRFPYRTMSDLMRHALKRHLVWLEEMKPAPKTVGMCLDAINEVLREEKDAREFSILIDRLHETVGFYTKQNNQASAARLVLSVRNNLTDMPDGDWKDRYIAEIDFRYGYLLNGLNRAKLTVVNDDS